MPQTILEMAKDLVMAQIQAGALPPDEMHKELQKTYASLVDLRIKEELGENGGGLAARGGRNLGFRRTVGRRGRPEDTQHRASGHHPVWNRGRTARRGTGHQDAATCRRGRPGQRPAAPVTRTNARN